MKMVSCICNVSVLATVLRLLDENGVRGYQVVNNVTGKNFKGDPRMDTAVWPGYSALVMMPFEHDADAHSVLQKMKDFNTQVVNDDELLSCYSYVLDDFFCE